MNFEIRKKSFPENRLIAKGDIRFMPHIVIDGNRIETTNGKTVIQAAYDNGIEIPHFCWHPELSVSGNCRMCLVELGLPKRQRDGSLELDSNDNPIVNFLPKLQIACATKVSDGMHIKTQTPKVVKARESVMEFILINHPLDCPICDEAGECKLQEYAFRFSTGDSRFVDEKNHKDKRVEWGPNVLYDAERCITCSRCIRYAKEIAHQDVLTFINRGDRVTIDLFEDTKFDNQYSMNVIELCPVGALTSRDFRFKSRVWDMSFNDSICTGCAKGCNTKLGVRNNQILKIEPRSNPYVNKHWLCDYGRLTQYKFVNENRILLPELISNNEKTTLTWEEANKKTAEFIKQYKHNEIMFIASPKATNEDNYLLQKFAKQIIKTHNIDFFNHFDKSFGDEFLRVNEKSPNINGLESLDIDSGNIGISTEQLIEKINNKQIKLVYVMDDDLEDYPEILDALANVETLIVHSHNHSRITDIANLILPSSTYAEVEGTFTNIDNRVQHFKPAIETESNVHSLDKKQSRLDKFGSHNDRWNQHEKRNSRPNWLVIMNVANLMGANWKYENTNDIFDEISTQISSFSGMTYELLDKYQGLVLNKADSPEPIVAKYESHKLKPM